jgi:cation diffusion facilitator CzcD-associated flavoprotein CzcO
VAEKAFDKIVVFEQRGRAGGIWVYTPEVNQDKSFSIPQTDPRGSVETPLWRTVTQPIFVSPVYDRLETNIPRSLMRFSDLAFPDAVQLFPEHPHVLEYLEKYSEDVKSLVRFKTQVTNLSLLHGESSTLKDQWSLSFVDLMTDIHETEMFDAVVVASGHFNLPYVPEIEGIREWNRQFPNSITHSKYFRRPDDYSGKVSITGLLANPRAGR